jgi:DNA polymerase-3 subunit alpha
MSSLNAHLGYRSHFALGESVLTPADIVKAVKDGGATAFAVCDTMSVSSMIELTKKAQKEGLRPCVGVRFRVIDTVTRAKGANKEVAYVKAFAKDEVGQRQIYALMTKAFDEEHFYETAHVTWADIEAVERGHLVWTTGDIDGIFTGPHLNTHLKALLKAVEPADVFVELIPINTPFYDRANAQAISAIIRNKLEPLVTVPALYKQGEYESFFVSLAIQKRSIIDKAFTVYAPHYEDSHPHHVGDLIPRVSAAKERIAARYSVDQSDIWKRGLLNAGVFLDRAPHVWSKQEVSLPVMSPDADKSVAAACAKGMKDRLFGPVNGFQPTVEDIREVYLPRLKYELGVLRDLKFATYFLVVSDVVNWSKEQNILVGPGRGSVGGSLVAYLMGITDVDPIRFGLLFERFINPSRNDLPDADLDFMSTRRHEVVQYIEDRHGTDYVAGITNFGELGAASAMRDVGRIYGMNVMDITVSKLVPKVHGQPVDLPTAAKEVAPIQEWAEKNADVWRNAVKLEGTMRSYGKHAAGIVVSGVPLTDRCVVERREGARVINWNMAVSEDAGLIKLDILGLSTLDTLSRCMAYIKERHGKIIDLASIPLDDEKTLAQFGAGKTEGVFQFEGGAARRILRDMAKTVPLTFDDLVAANALNRPGPIEAGLVKQYVDAKNGDAEIALPHPNMEGALGETFNVLCYQEQVMRVSVDLSGFDLSEADKLRKAMGKKDPVLMASYRDKFVDGAHTTSGMDKEQAGEIFDQIEKFAGYAFNKSHAVEYSLISYQCAWLKANYPVEFYAAALSTVDEAKLPPIVADADRCGIAVLPPDVNISTGEFVIANDTTLYVPFNRVKGISDKATNAIIAGRAATSVKGEHKERVGRRVIKTEIDVPVKKGVFESVDDFRSRVPGNVVNVRHMEALDKIGAFHRLVPGSLPALHEDRRRDQHELIPGLMAHHVVIGRYMDNGDKYTKIGINQVYADVDTVIEKAVNCRPYWGKNARFVAVFDAPGRQDELNKQVASSDSFHTVADALFEAGMDRNDGYFTSLVKRVKSGSMLSGSEIATYAPFLERELELLKPPLIIALGSNAVRYLCPEIKGNVMDYMGKVFYDRKRDANILIGFTPGMIFHAPEKQADLNNVFELASRLVD